MIRLRLGTPLRSGIASLACLLAVPAAACSDSVTVTPDGGGITFDAGPPDLGPDLGPIDMRMAVCGDGILDPGEMCDPGMSSMSPCNRDCTFMAFCGDRRTDPGEECDDGNNLSGDGCSARCTLEDCGNGILDIGEVCDGTPGCCPARSTTCMPCMEVTTCGNGAVDMGEECDPGMTPPGSWDDDGCQADCLRQQSLVVNMMRIDESMGCDYSGDGVPDNSFGRAFGGGLALLNMQLEQALSRGDLTLLLSMLGMRSATMDPDVRIGWVTGSDADMDRMNNFTGMGRFFGDAAAFGPDRQPLTSFGGDIRGGRVDAGPEDIVLNVAVFPLDLRRGRILGELQASRDGQLTGLRNGLLCGAIPVRTFATLPNFLEMFGGGMFSFEPCAVAGDPVVVEDETLGDLLLGGARVLGIRLGPAQPDVDLDGDGLESYIIDREGPPGCQPVVVGCIDGDGTRIMGHECTSDPRMQDGWSAGLPFTAVGAQIVGVR
jgi:cysteine-rich repeat protein